MNILVCSLFEFSYSDGAGVLINTLIRNGFSGQLIFGYRGSIPVWVKSLKRLPSVAARTKRYQVGSNVTIDFMLLETTIHLTNYKPEFMLDISSSPLYEFDALLYLDADIVVKEHWSFFEDWLSCGVALCEDVNSPYHASHPRRHGWKNFYASEGIKFTNTLNNIYVNGGAIGVRREDLQFLKNWFKFTHAMTKKIGSLNAAKVLNGIDIADNGFAHCFDSTDQDSLNATLDAYSRDVSILGKEAMCFKAGHCVLPHAIGRIKPWNKNILLDILYGKSPRMVDKIFWNFADYPVRVTTKPKIYLNKLLILLSSFVSRFYSCK